MNDYISYNSAMPKARLTRTAQRLRREATKEENQLWYQFLKQHRLRFKRQMVLGNHVIDFYCAEAKLVIELDGSQHFEELILVKDASRDDYLRSKGLMVVRFLNSDIWDHFSDVCATIDNLVNPEIAD